MNIHTTDLMHILIEERRASDVVAVGDKGEKIVWLTLYADVADLCARLGNVSGQRWLVAEADAYRLIVGLLGVLHAGGVPVLPANLEQGHLQEIAATTDGLLSDLGETADRNGDGAVLPALPDGASELVLYTSGSTGRPLELIKPIACLDAEVRELEVAFGSKVTSNVFGTVPPYHIYGLLFRVLWPIATRRCFAATSIQYPEELAGMAADVPIGVLVSSPAFLKRVEEFIDFGRLCDAETQIFSSGGPLPTPVGVAYNNLLTRPVIEVYGSTETGGIGYRSVLDADQPAPWTRFPAVLLKIDLETSVLSVQSSYIPSLTPIVTGDRVRRLDEDTFELLGRVDRILKIEECRISLTELEQRLSACTEIACIRVVALEGQNGRQIMGAIVQPTEVGWATLAEHGKRVLTEALATSLKEYIAAVAVPRRWRFVRTLPEDARGKTTDEALRDLFVPGAARKTTPIVLEKSVNDDSAVIRLRFPSDLVFFDGHFDVAPILPGVVQLGMAVEFGANLLPISSPPKRVDALKFFNVLTPDREVSLELVYDPGVTTLRFRFFDDDTTFSSGRIVCGKSA